MYVTLPWFVAAIFFGVFFGFWLALDNRWGNARTDQLDDDLDRHRKASNDRLERAEDWIDYLHETIRRPDVAPPMPAPVWAPRQDEPETQPDLPETQPQQVIPRRVEDVALARVLAEMEDRIHDWHHNKETAA